MAAALDCPIAGCRCPVVLIFHSVHLVSNPSIWDLNGSEFGYFRVARDLEIYSQHAYTRPVADPFNADLVSPPTE